jgi:hypothetical protein
VIGSERDGRASFKVIEDGGEVRDNMSGVVVWREFVEAAQQHDRWVCRPAQGEEHRDIGARNRTRRR